MRSSRLNESAAFARRCAPNRRRRILQDRCWPSLPQSLTVTEACTVRGAPTWATRLPVLAPVRLLGPIVDQ